MENNVQNTETVKPFRKLAFIMVSGSLLVLFILAFYAVLYNYGESTYKKDDFYFSYIYGIVTAIFAVIFIFMVMARRAYTTREFTIFMLVVSCIYTVVTIIVLTKSTLYGVLYFIPLIVIITGLGLQLGYKPKAPSLARRVYMKEFEKSSFYLVLTGCIAAVVLSSILTIVCYIQMKTFAELRQSVIASANHGIGFAGLLLSTIMLFIVVICGKNTHYGIIIPILVTFSLGCLLIPILVITGDPGIVTLLYFIPAALAITGCIKQISHLNSIKDSIREKYSFEPKQYY